MAVLQTARLTLSPCSPGDRHDFMALEQDAEVMRFLNGGRAVDHERGEVDPTFMMPRGTEDHLWTARRVVDGDFVGWFCLWPETTEMGELGYRLRREVWGQGFASEGAAALVDWGFAHSGYEKIFASTMTVNMPSRRVLEKIGMKFSHTIHPDWPRPFAGTDEGEVVYEIMRSARSPVAF